MCVCTRAGGKVGGYTKTTVRHVESDCDVESLMSAPDVHWPSIGFLSAAHLRKRNRHDRPSTPTFKN